MVCVLSTGDQLLAGPNSSLWWGADLQSFTGDWTQAVAPVHGDQPVMRGTVPPPFSAGQHRPRLQDLSLEWISHCYPPAPGLGVSHCWGVVCNSNTKPGSVTLVWCQLLPPLPHPNPHPHPRARSGSVTLLQCSCFSPTPHPQPTPHTTISDTPAVLSFVGVAPNNQAGLDSVAPWGVCSTSTGVVAPPLPPPRHLLSPQRAMRDCSTVLTLESVLCRLSRCFCFCFCFVFAVFFGQQRWLVQSWRQNCSVRAEEKQEAVASVIVRRLSLANWHAPEITTVMWYMLRFSGCGPRMHFIGSCVPQGGEGRGGGRGVVWR